MPSTPHVEIQGIDTVVGVLRSAAASANPQLSARIYRAMQVIFKETQRQCPKRTGTLRASGSVSLPDRGEVSIGYGGPAAEYAVWVHENLQAKHKPPTKAKFVEDPMHQAGPTLLKMTDDIEASMLRQYPQAPSIAAAADAEDQTKSAHNNAGIARVKQAMATSHAIGPDQIRAALKSASAHPGRMIRQRGR